MAGELNPYLAGSESLAFGFQTASLRGEEAVDIIGLLQSQPFADEAFSVLLDAYLEAAAFNNEAQLEGLGPVIAEMISQQRTFFDAFLDSVQSPALSGTIRFADPSTVRERIAAHLAVKIPGRQKGGDVSKQVSVGAAFARPHVQGGMRASGAEDPNKGETKMSDLRKKVEAAFKEANALFEKAKGLQAAGDPKVIPARVEARTAYRKIFEVDPQATAVDIHVATCMNMAVLYMEEDDFTNAISVLKRVLQLDPNHLEARFKYAVAAHHFRQHPQYLEEAMEQASLFLQGVAKQGKQALGTPVQNIIVLLREELEMAVSQKNQSAAKKALEILQKHDPDKQSVNKYEKAVAEMEPTAAKEVPKKFSKRRDLVELSRQLAYALRHASLEYELDVDPEGWILLDPLIAALNAEPLWQNVTREIVEKTVREVGGGRYEISGNRIRALYGHSISQTVAKQVTEPPALLYHGTDRQFLFSILTKGLIPGARHHVHLTTSREKALQVARRKGKDPAIIPVLANEAFKKGVKFYVGSDEIWLADPIPPKFFDLGDDDEDENKD